MRKLLSGGFVLLAGALSLPAPGSIPGKAETPVADHRLVQLRDFFGKFGCPAKEYADDFLDVADTYELDWRLLPSISFLESTGGKWAPNHNLFGWNSGRTSFATPRDGIVEVGARLAQSDIYREKDLDEMLAIYNPVGEYARKVKSVMAQIAPNK